MLSAKFRSANHNGNTENYCLAIMQVLVYGLWATAPLVTDTLFGAAKFIVLLGMIEFVSSNVMGLITALLQVCTSRGITPCPCPCYGMMMIKWIDEN